MRAQSSHANLASASLLITSTLFLFATGAIAADSNHHPKDAAAAKVAADDAYGKLPLSFEANRGQTDRQVKFLSRGSGYALFLTPTEAVMSLKAGDGQRDKKDSVLPVSRRPGQVAAKAAVLRVRLQHANPNPEISGIDELAGKSNYFVGNNPATWQRNIPTFGKVKYQQVYSGVDLVYYGNQRHWSTISCSPPAPTPGRLNSALPAPGDCGSILTATCL